MNINQFRFLSDSNNYQLFITHSGLRVQRYDEKWKKTIVDGEKIHVNVCKFPIKYVPLHRRLTYNSFYGH